MWLRGVGVRSLGHSSQKFWSGIAFWNLPIEISLNTKNPYWHLKINPNLIRSTVFSKNGCRGTKKQVVEVWMSYMVFNISPNACLYYASKTVNVLKSNLLSCTVQLGNEIFMMCIFVFVCWWNNYSKVFLNALASLVLVMTVGLQFFREILSSGLEVNKTKEQKDNRISGLQPYNLTTLQLYNFTTIKD